MYVYDNILLNSSRKRNSFRKKGAEKIKTHISYHRHFFFWKSCHLHDNYKKNDTDRQAIDDRTQYGAEKNIPIAHGVIKTKIHGVIIFNTCCVRNVVW